MYIYICIYIYVYVYKIKIENNTNENNYLKTQDTTNTVTGIINKRNKSSMINWL